MNADDLHMLRSLRAQLGETRTFTEMSMRAVLDIADELINEIEALSAENADLYAQVHHHRVLSLPLPGSGGTGAPLVVRGISISGAPRPGLRNTSEHVECDHAPPHGHPRVIRTDGGAA